MKKFVLFLILILSNSYLFYGQPAIQWQKSVGGFHEDYAGSVQVTYDGGYIIAGGTNSQDGDALGNFASYNFWVFKLDSLGNFQWQNFLGGSENDGAYSIKQTYDSGFIASGYTWSNDSDVFGNHGQQDYWIVKLDKIGNLQWQKCLGGSTADIAKCINQTREGGYIVTGASYSNSGDVTGNHGGYDFWIVKLNSNGDIVWQKCFGGTNDDMPSYCEQTGDGGFIVTGFTNSNDGDITFNHGASDYWIIKLDSMSNLQWEKSLGGDSTDWAYSIAQTNDNGFIVAGYSNSINGDVTGNHGGTDYWIVKLNSIGSIEWQRSYGGTSEEGQNILFNEPISINQTLDNGYIIAGNSNSNDGDVSGGHNSSDYWVLKLDSVGDIIWDKCYGGICTDKPVSAQLTKDGGYILVGNISCNGGDITNYHGSIDIWLVKLSLIIDIEEIQNSILNFQVTPNPFSNETIISFQLSSSDKADVEIHDVEGRQIKIFNYKNLSKGSNKIHWDATDNSGTKVSDGIYFVNIISDNFCESKKVVVLKN